LGGPVGNSRLISDRFPGGELAEHDPEKWMLFSEKTMLL
jgi:hypothetical protein